jgi:acetyltransferase-like isoleucine patch superfamily enzyme
MSSLDARFAEALANKKDRNRAVIKGTDFLYFLGNLEEHEFGQNMVYCRGELPKNLKLSFAPRAKHNIVIVGAMRSFNVRCAVEGSDNVVHIGSSKAFHGDLTVTGSRNLFFTADAVTCNHANFVLVGNDVSIAFGCDCMLSYGISIRASDGHAIVSLKDKQVINFSESVLVHPHVWIGENATILKGTTIERGSIIAAHALVTRDVPACSLAVGIPAKVLRQDVSWTREADPSPTDIDDMLNTVRPSGLVSGLIRQLFPRAQKAAAQDEPV